MTSFRRPSLSLAFTLLAPALALAQAPSGGSAVSESARVVVIEIPVNVVDKDGRPIAGLTAADYELTDDGKKQEIASVDVIDLNRATATPKASSTPAAADPFLEAPPPARRHWLLVFDFSYSSLNGLLRAREGARGFVRTAMKPHDLASVATFSVDTGWKLLVNFTRDREQLTQAIGALGLPATGSRTTDPLAFAVFQPQSGGGVSGGGAAREQDAVARENVQDAQRLRRGPPTTAREGGSRSS